MGKQVMIGEGTYRRLAALKDKYPGKQSFNSMLVRLMKEYGHRNILAEELSIHFKHLQKELAGTMMDGLFLGVVERLRIIVINVAKLDPMIQAEVLTFIEARMDSLMTASVKTVHEWITTKEQMMQSFLDVQMVSEKKMVRALRKVEEKKEDQTCPPDLVKKKEVVKGVVKRKNRKAKK